MEQKSEAQRLAEIKEWKVIYPIYINKCFSRQKGKISKYNILGRRIPIASSVENPTMQEMIQV